MRYILFYIIFVFLAFSQIEHGGYPNFINSDMLDKITRIETRSESLVEKDYHPMVFIFGDEYEVNYDMINNIPPIYRNNTYTYLLKVESSGAYGLGMIFNDFYLSNNVTLYLYDYDGSMYFGAFTSENNKESNIFPTNIVKSDKIIIELNIPEEEFGNSRLNIGSIIHDNKDILKYYINHSNNTREDCNVNVSCPESFGFENQINGTIRVTMGGGLCSASLINNTLNDRTPYVLFADHCVSGSPNSYVFLFNYQSTTCNGTTSAQNQSVSGSTLLTSADIDSGPDFALLELTSNIPNSYEPFFVGWSKVNTPPQAAIGIHHPGGDIKKITQDASNVFANGYYWEFQFNDGRVIPGSSGSPLFDQNKRQVGIASFIYTNYCDPSPDCYCSQQYNHGYGRFDQAWNMGLSQYLDPINSGVNYIDGIGLSGIAISHENLIDVPFENNLITVDAVINSYDGQIETANLYYNKGDGWNSTELIDIGNNYTGNIQGLYEGMIIEYYLSASNTLGETQFYPPSGQEDAIYFTVGDLPDYYFTNFELGLNNWTISDNTDDATSGIWVLAEPIATFNDDNIQIQPGNDYSLNGTYCFVTGNGFEQENGGFDDVDGGKTTLISPSFNLNNYSEVLITYWYWYTNNAGDNGGNDLWKVQVSSNDGNTWIDIHVTSNSNNNWTKKRIKLSDFIDLNSDVQFRFIAEDIAYDGDNGSGGSLVEAAIDDFLIETFSPQTGSLGDVNDDQLINILDVILIVNMILELQPSNYLMADLNIDGRINIQDIILLLNIILN